jgi:hypothetical protein
MVAEQSENLRYSVVGDVVGAILDPSAHTSLSLTFSRV